MASTIIRKKNVRKYTSYTPSAVSVPTGTNTNVGSFTLSAGTWMCLISGRFGANNYNNRKVYLSDTSGGSDLGIDAQIAKDAVPSRQTYIQFLYYTTVTANTTFYIVAWQNSGSAINFTPRVKYMRLY